MVVQGGGRLEVGKTCGWDLKYVKNPILTIKKSEREVSYLSYCQVVPVVSHKGSRVISSEIPVVKWLKIQSIVKTEWNMKKLALSVDNKFWWLTDS